jgi:hypothetical protein
MLVQKLALVRFDLDALGNAWNVPAVVLGKTCRLGGKLYGVGCVR